VLVTRSFLGVDTDRAFAVVVDLMTSRMKQFEHVLAEELPAMFDDLGLDEEARTGVLGYADEFKDWMAGIAHWHENCRRYTDAALRYQPIPRFGANGLGTAAAQVVRLFRVAS
jgi:germacradienol/geosmin synthase